MSKASKAGRKKKSQDVGFGEIILPEVLQMTDPDIKVRYIPMTEEEKREWAHNWARLCLDSYEKEHGSLPPPPSEEEFHMMWEEMMKKQ